MTPRIDQSMQDLHISLSNTKLEIHHIFGRTKLALLSSEAIRLGMKRNDREIGFSTKANHKVLESNEENSLNPIGLNIRNRLRMRLDSESFDFMYRFYNIYIKYVNEIDPKEIQEDLKDLIEQHFVAGNGLNVQHGLINTAKLLVDEQYDITKFIPIFAQCFKHLTDLNQNIGMVHEQINDIKNSLYRSFIEYKYFPLLQAQQDEVANLEIMLKPVALSETASASQAAHSSPPSHRRTLSRKSSTGEGAALVAQEHHQSPTLQSRKLSHSHSRHHRSPSSSFHRILSHGAPPSLHERTDSQELDALNQTPVHHNHNRTESKETHYRGRSPSALLRQSISGIKHAMHKSTENEHKTLEDPALTKLVEIKKLINDTQKTVENILSDEQNFLKSTDELQELLDDCIIKHDLDFKTKTDILERLTRVDRFDPQLRDKILQFIDGYKNIFQALAAQIDTKKPINKNNTSLSDQEYKLAMSGITDLFDQEQEAQEDDQEASQEIVQVPSDFTKSLNRFKASLNQFKVKDTSGSELFKETKSPNGELSKAIEDLLDTAVSMEPSTFVEQAYNLVNSFTKDLTKKDNADVVLVSFFQAFIEEIKTRSLQPTIS